ncbi:MAG: GtrA family protein [Microcoleaceae cyanobacterium]
MNYKKIIDKKIVRYIFCGIITAIFNIVIIDLIIRFGHINSPFMKNIANAIAIELSLIFTFFVYKTWVWTVEKWHWLEILKKEIPKFHITFGGSVLARIFVIFPLLNWLGVNHQINTLIGIAIGAVVNYTISDKWVFAKKSKQLVDKEN